MNCAERLVEIFGTQADVARAFQLDRAVVHNWVKTGYVPARWAGEVERIAQGSISAVDVINEASQKNPVRVKSRPDDAPFGLSESDPLMPTSQFAPAKRIQSFHPPQRTLMGPGPTEIHPRVLTTMSQPAIGYLDPVFVEMMEELKSLLRYVYQTKNALTFPISGPGSVGMEFCFVNMVAPGDKVVVCQNGVFGGRMLETPGSQRTRVCASASTRDQTGVRRVAPPKTSWAARRPSVRSYPASASISAARTPRAPVASSR